MSIFINDGPLAICDRCRKKVLRKTLTPDRNSPGLMVCRNGGCNDVYDPWRLPWTPKDADISVDRPRPEQQLDVPTTMTGVNDAGEVEEVPVTPPADRVVKSSSS